MKTDNAKIFLEAQLGLEGLKVVNGNRIVKIQAIHFNIEKNKNAEPPKVIAINFENKISVFYSDLISNMLLADLERLEKYDFIGNQEKVTKILKENNQFEELGHYIAYVFPKNIEVDFDKTQVFVGSEDETIKEFDTSFYQKYPMVYATMKDGKIVACCVSSRENDLAGEAWIFTLPEHRKQGFGLKAVQLWASELQKNGKIPFYTHKRSNIASQKLAEKLNLIKVFKSITYE